MGCKLTPQLIKREQEVWDRVGIEWCESIKSEINRGLGKEIEEMTGKVLNRRSPDITILLDLNTGEIRLDVRSIYVFGKYQKLVRGIPQTKWKKKVYKTSVQELIEKPFLKRTKAEETKFHGSGREDINVRCLGWRPFVIELVNPRKRKFKLRGITTEMKKSKKVKVKGLKFVKKRMIRNVKTTKRDKTYLAEVKFKDKVKNLKRLKDLEESVISQKTPKRVLRRRAKKVRRRRVIKIKYKLLGEKVVELKIRAQAGLYAKEFITGDEGRTRPSVSETLENEVKGVKLDVIKIHGD